ncbi:MAG: sel1 repeat family protein [Muribaculaceae bacterium]|nr:sel1 repeat family protein [Muribaculaceae bacterium]
MNKILLSAIIILFGGLGCHAKTAKIPKSNADSIAAAERTREIRDSLNVIMDKAKGGDASAMNEVGTWYYTGKHVAQDYAQAYEWWKKASLKANVRGIANLGLCYQLGHGVERDSIDAIRLYLKSIKEGNKTLLSQRSENAMKSAFDAMLVGDCYENGIGVNKDYTKAAQFYSQAAAQGSVDGMRQAGICYLNAKENSKALQYFERGASKGDLSCEYWAGKMLMGGMSVPSNKQQGVVYLLKAAEGGMPAAQTEMGILYAEGDGVTKNLQQAAEWHRKSALQGNAKGMWNYGNALKDGSGVSKDYDQALFWMTEASPQGYQRAFKKMVAEMDSIGNDPFMDYLWGMKLYLIDGNMKEATEQFKKVEKAKIDEGKIMQSVILTSQRNEKPNAKKAAKELEKLAPTNPEAAFYLATLYETGNGVAQDMTKAIELYRKSADMDYGKAQCYLADIYYEGRGTDKDLATAVSLYQHALQNRQLTQNGATRLAECYENGLAGLQTDKKQAEQLRKWKYQDNIVNVIKELNL